MSHLPPPKHPRESSDSEWGKANNLPYALKPKHDQPSGWLEKLGTEKIKEQTFFDAFLIFLLEE